MNGVGFAALIVLGVVLFLIWEYWPTPDPDDLPPHE